MLYCDPATFVEMSEAVTESMADANRRHDERVARMGRFTHDRKPAIAAQAKQILASVREVLRIWR
jgi:hypothetical protein